jgi:hypothetical protein
MTKEDALVDVAERSAELLEDDDGKELILGALRTHSREPMAHMADDRGWQDLGDALFKAAVTARAVKARAGHGVHTRPGVQAAVAGLG